MKNADNQTTKKAVLFVCLGNICRSPAAQGIFESLVKKEGLGDNFTVDSAGTYGGHAGDKADHRMRAAAQRRGVELTHRSRQVKSDDFEIFDHIIAMDDSNFHDLRRLAPTIEAQNKISRMASYFTAHTIDHVPDPYYEGAQGFEYVLDLLEDGCQELLSKLL